MVVHHRVQIGHRRGRAHSGRRRVADRQKACPSRYGQKACPVPVRAGVEILVYRYVQGRGRGRHDVGQVRVAVLGGDRFDRCGQPLEVGRHRRRVPAGRAARHPVGKVGVRRTQRDHRVMRRAASQDPGSGLADAEVAAWPLNAAVVEVVLAIEHLEPAPDLQRSEARRDRRDPTRSASLAEGDPRSGGRR